MKITVNYKGINKQMLNAEKYEDIVRFVHQNFFLKMSKWSMSYIDADGDAISIDSDLDLETMIETSGRDNMKIYIKDVLADEEETHLAQEIDIQVAAETSKIQPPKKIELEPVVEPVIIVAEAKIEQQPLLSEPKIQEEREKQIQKKVGEQQGSSENVMHENRHPVWNFDCHGGKGMWKKKMEEKMARLVDERVEALLPYIIKRVEEKLQNKQEKPAVPIKTEEVNHKVKCNLCGTDPIFGIRYKCTKCPLFNLCQKCEQNTGHNHNLIKMKFLEEEEPAEERKPWWKQNHHMFMPPPPPMFGNGVFPPPPPPFMQPSNNFGPGMCPPPFRVNPFEMKSVPSFFPMMGQKKQEEKELDPRFKITKKCFKMSQMFGEEPKVYEDFVTKNLDLKVEDLVQLYITMNEKAKLSQEVNQKVLDKAHKLAFYFGKPAETYTELVAMNPAFNFKKLIQIAKQQKPQPQKPQPEPQPQKSQPKKQSEQRPKPKIFDEPASKPKNIQKRNACVLEMKELFGDEKVFDYINFYNLNSELENSQIIQLYIEKMEQK